MAGVCVRTLSASRVGRVRGYGVATVRCFVKGRELGERAVGCGSYLVVLVGGGWCGGLVGGVVVAVGGGECGCFVYGGVWCGGGCCWFGARDQQLWPCCSGPVSTWPTAPSPKAGASTGICRAHPEADAACTSHKKRRA